MLGMCPHYNPIVEYDGEFSATCNITEDDSCFCDGNKIYCDFYQDMRVSAVDELMKSSSDMISRRHLLKNLLSHDERIPKWIVNTIMEEQYVRGTN